MTREDKELIRLAARAFFGTEDEATHAIVSLGWNPLTNNEDAFMLMAFCSISARVVGNTAWASNCRLKGTDGARPLGEYGYTVNVDATCCESIYQAFRLAICRVAAKIGKDMEELERGIKLTEAGAP